MLRFFHTFFCSGCYYNMWPYFRPVLDRYIVSFCWVTVSIHKSTLWEPSLFVFLFFLPFSILNSIEYVICRMYFFYLRGDMIPMFRLPLHSLHVDFEVSERPVNLIIHAVTRKFITNLMMIPGLAITLVVKSARGLLSALCMMTSSNGNIFRVTGHLCGKFTGPRWISRTKASDAELWCFLWFTPE